MFKNRTIIEVEVKGRHYRLECASESPLVEVQEAIAVMHALVVDRINALQKPQETEEMACSSD